MSYQVNEHLFLACSGGGKRSGLNPQPVTVTGREKGRQLRDSRPRLVC